MTFGQSVLIGLIQGITDFLPISSLGHKAVFQQFFRVNLEADGLYGAMLGMGALVTICLVFYKEIWKILLEVVDIIIDSFGNCIIFFKNFSHEKTPYNKIVKTAYRRWIMMILISTIPTVIIGYLGKDVFQRAGNGLLIPGICFLVTAVALLLCDSSNGGSKKPKEIPYINAFSIGMVQGIALLPGLSRAGTVMTAGVLSGFDKKFAVKYSFIMFIPMLIGAIIRSFGNMESVVRTPGEIAGYIAGMVVTIIVGYVCLKITILMVKSKKLKIFSIYCLAMGILSIYGHFYII